MSWCAACTICLRACARLASVRGVGRYGMNGSSERVKHGSDLHARANGWQSGDKPSATRAHSSRNLRPMTDVGAIWSHSETESSPRPLGASLDASVAELAERQHGVVALRQLRALGLGSGAIKRRSSNGRLQLVHVGVYAVGHRQLSANGHRMAAVLACGSEAVLG